MEVGMLRPVLGEFGIDLGLMSWKEWIIGDIRITSREILERALLGWLCSCHSLDVGLDGLWPF